MRPGLKIATLNAYGCRTATGILRARLARIVGIFPDEAAVVRLVVAILADIHEGWQSDERRYRRRGRWPCLSPPAILASSPSIDRGEKTPKIDPHAHHFARDRRRG